MITKIKKYFESRFPTSKNMADEKGVSFTSAILRCIQLSITIGIILSVVLTVEYNVNVDQQFKGTYVNNLMYTMMLFAPIPLIMGTIHYLGRWLLWAGIKEQELSSKLQKKILNSYIKKYYKKHKKDPPIFTKLNNMNEKTDNWFKSKPKWMKRLASFTIIIIIIGIQLAIRLPSIIHDMSINVVNNSTQIIGTIPSPLG